MTPARGPYDADGAYRELSPLVFSIAYRMLGSATDAEDAVQETYVRFHDTVRGGSEIASPKAFLSAVVTRLCIDRLRSAAHRREVYDGQWLPEPLLTDRSASDPFTQVEQADSLSMAFLLLLERLNPVERAVFLLRDVFGYDFDEIAGIIDKGETNCRQIASRARRRVQAEKPRFEASRERRDALATQFFAAFTDGDMDGLVRLLAEDVVTYGDGGGKAPQWSHPISGAHRVARLFMAMSKQLHEHAITVEQHEINGQAGAILRSAVGEIVNVFVLDIAAGQVQTVRSVINPDKLRHLGPVADVRSMGKQNKPRPER